MVAFILNKTSDFIIMYSTSMSFRSYWHMQLNGYVYVVSVQFYIIAIIDQ